MIRTSYFTISGKYSYIIISLHEYKKNVLTNKYKTFIIEIIITILCIIRGICDNQSTVEINKTSINKLLSAIWIAYNL